MAAETCGIIVIITRSLVSRIVVVVVELPRLLCTVVGRKPANPPQESDDIRGICLDKFPVGQERLPKGFPSLLTPRRTPQEMFSVLSTSPSFRSTAVMHRLGMTLLVCALPRVPIKNPRCGRLRTSGELGVESLVLLRLCPDLAMLTHCRSVGCRD